MTARAAARLQNLISTPVRALRALTAVAGSAVAVGPEARPCVHGLNGRSACEECSLDDFLFFRDAR
jgi:hypothetical protein